MNDDEIEPHSGSFVALTKHLGMPSGAALLVTIAVACSSSEGAAVIRARIAEGCTINSDCAAPFVCVFKTCHEQCTASRDCPAGTRCVQAERLLHVCQLPEERACTRSSDCQGLQICGTDGQCRDACAVDRDCLEGQTCASGACFDAAELVDEAVHGAPDAGEGHPCARAADCDEPLVCLRGVCDVECVGDKDCWIGWTCEETRCRAPRSAPTPDAGTECVHPLDGGLGVAASFSVSKSNDCAIRPDGTLWCWGIGSPDGLPFEMTSLGLGVADVSSADGHTCARKTDGTLWCWGSNSQGQLGDGTTTTRATPVAITALGAGVASVSAGLHHTCAVKTDGSLWCWGGNDWGQLGDGTTTGRVTPLQVVAIDEVAEVSVGRGSTCARKTEGTLWCWGDNSYGQLGDGTTTPRSIPTQVAAALGQTSHVTVGASGHACAVFNEALWCWGRNSSGQLGDGTTTDRASPVLVALGNTVVSSVSAGMDYTCARMTDRSLWCWGVNSRGELGDGSSITRTTPVQVVALGTDILAVSAGWEHTCAQKSDGTVWCWGANDSFQLGDGTSTSRSSPGPVRMPCP